MKSLFLLITVLFSTFIFSHEAKGVAIEVIIDNVTSDDGKVILGLHTSETFMIAEGIKKAESKIVSGKVTITFKNVQPGTYAVIALHDKNENNRMDFENGMPKESYGSSNNPMDYGPPQFSASKFEVGNENLKMNIRF